MVLPNFVRQAINGEAITVYGSGQQSRCFCDVADTVEAMLRLIGTQDAIGEVVNIGSEQEISIEGLAHRVKELTKSASPIQFIPYDQAYEPGFEDMPRRVPSTEKLQRLTGFRPATQLNAIIERVLIHETARRVANARQPESVGVGPDAARAIAI
jgi:nucleoside-diphosphate-sugar epimerase